MQNPNNQITLTISATNGDGLEALSLKVKYFQCFGVRTTNAEALQEVVKGFLGANCEGAIRRNGKAATRSGVRLHSVRAIPFNQNVTTTQKAGNQTRVMPL